MEVKKRNWQNKKLVKKIRKKTEKIKIILNLQLDDEEYQIFKL